jgi:hypothetical protein
VGVFLLLSFHWILQEYKRFYSGFFVREGSLRSSLEGQEGSRIPTRTQSQLKSRREGGKTFSKKWSQMRYVVVAKETALLLGVVFMQQSYRISLFGLYFAGLKSVNLLNAGYMVFFIFFIIASQLASTLWIFLVLYSQLVLVVLCFFNIHLPFTIPSSSENPLYGLKLNSEKPLWIDVFWNSLTMVFTVLQWNIIKKVLYFSFVIFFFFISVGSHQFLKAKLQKERLMLESVRPENADSSTETSEAEYVPSYVVVLRKLHCPEWFVIIADVAVWEAKRYLIWISYLVIFLVAVFDRFSLISIAYMLLLFI